MSLDKSPLQCRGEQKFGQVKGLFFDFFYPSPFSENCANCDIKFLENVTSREAMTEKHGALMQALKMLQRGGLWSPCCCPGELCCVHQAACSAQGPECVHSLHTFWLMEEGS